MKTVVSATDAARHLGDYLARVRFKHEHFVLTKNDKPVAELSPAIGSGAATWGELCRAVKGFPLDPAFADDLETVNRSDAPLPNPWD
ncbi:MAG TPA: type II toxin-antitoxin system Phd/YefM family antitoxin [Kiritimatiellia bacterium]|nr:type II toxin-antitoxin system Phd/YefM family antitoxin [Kiritimatiellia bacterium]